MGLSREVGGLETQGPLLIPESLWNSPGHSGSPDLDQLPCYTDEDAGLKSESDLPTGRAN